MKIKITKSKIKTFFTYDAVKMIAAIVLVCFLLLFIFSWVGAKPTAGQQFNVLVDRSITYNNKATSFISETFDKEPNEGGFSYDVLTAGISKMAEDGTQEATLNNTYAALGDDDVVVLTAEILQEYVLRDNATELMGFPSEAKKFLADNGMLVNGEISKSGVDAYFIKTRSKDNRFKTESQINEGKDKEFKRIQAILNNANALERVFSAHPEILTYKEYDYYDEARQGYYAIDFSKLNGNGTNSPLDLFKLATETNNVYTTNGIYIAIGTNFDKNGDLYYETLAFLYSLISEYSTYLS